MHIRVIPLARVCIGVEFLPHNKRQVEMIYLKPGIVVTSIALSLGLVNSIPSPVHKHIVKPKLVQPVIVKETSQFAKWDTTNYDKTATLPDATDPTRLLPGAVQEKFACIRYHESRNHLHSVSYSGAGGWYQFMPSIWQMARSVYPGLPAKPQEATGDQQSQAAVWFYLRNHGFYPEWQLDTAC